MISNILNLITLSRIFCAIEIYLFLFLEAKSLAALVLFFIASFYDFLDGYIERKTK